jgi:hypothetical protein
MDQLMFSVAGFTVGENFADIQMGTDSWSTIETIVG